jgi:alginate O-acetyltransferase complex protein AlgI
VVLDHAAGTLGELRPGIYVNYCLNFTTFLMGPIQRYQDFRDQWTGAKGSIEPGFEGHLDAVTRIVRGLVKKFVLAEFLAYETIYADMDFGALSVPLLAVRTYAFYAYLYCDFSGYCDVVIGTGSLMGVRPPENFRFPFLARNVAEYWLRVHRSLTTWLTDYVFNPAYAAILRTGWARGRTLAPVALALCLTMLVSGLWHGTTLAFVCFGLLHAVFLVVHRAYAEVMKNALGAKRFRAFSANRAVHAAAVLITWNVTSIAYLFFVLDIHGVWRLTRRILEA